MPESATMDAPAAPAQTQSAPPAVAGTHDEAYAAFDALATPGGDGPKRAPAKAAEPAKPQDKPVETKPVEAVKPDDKAKPADDTPPERMAPKALRDALARTKDQLKAAQDELKTVKTTAATPKEFKVDDAPEYKSLKEKHAAILKRNEELEDSIRYTDYEASKEYKEQYQAPYESAAKGATTSAQQLKVTTGSADEGTLASRNMTAQEFWDIVQIGDEDQAVAAAEKLFGPGTKAARVIQLRDSVLTAHNKAAEAKDTFKKTGAERAKAMQEQQEGFTKQQAESFAKHRDEAITKYPQWFKADEGDTKGAEVLENGFKWADAAFGDLPPEQAVKHHAAMRNKAGAFDHVVYKLNSTRAELKAVQEKLAQFEKSKPGTGEPGEAAKGSEDDSIEGGWSRLDKMASNQG